MTAIHATSPGFDLGMFQRTFTDLTRYVEHFVQGKSRAVTLSLYCLFAEGHLLIEDVPGVAKTSLAKAIASAIHGSLTRRIQFTPDLLPSDVTGVRFFNQKIGDFELQYGPVFANIVHGDEINRASPKTQSALLEVMAEGRVTIDGQPLAVPKPFFCVATQNPIEHRGTYSLPEAQLDRFMMRIDIGYPDHSDEMRIIAARTAGRADLAPPPVIDVRQTEVMIEMARRVHVGMNVTDYIVQIVSRTRDRRHCPELCLGVSPRGSIALGRAAQVRAASEGRDFVSGGDIKYLAVPVLAHRLVMTPEAAFEGVDARAVIDRVVSSVPVPQDVRQ